MARILIAGVYMADRLNTAAHLLFEFGGKTAHEVVQRWIALAPMGTGRVDLPMTEIVVVEPTPKFALLDEVTSDAADFDWLLLCDDDVEVGPNFLEQFIDLSTRLDFALCQPARTVDSFTDHPIVQVMPGLVARATRFVEIGPVVCIRRDAMPFLLPFGRACGMGWGLDYIWGARLEKIGLRMGIVDATPIAHRIRKPVSVYQYPHAFDEMCRNLAGERHLSVDEAFCVLDIYT